MVLNNSDLELDFRFNYCLMVTMMDFSELSMFKTMIMIRLVIHLEKIQIY